VIQANVEPPKNLFAFKAPNGFELTEIKEATPVRSIGTYSSGSSGDRGVSLWVMIKLSDEAVLMCWSQSTQVKDGKGWFNYTPRIVLQGSEERECSERALYETRSGDVLWRWSIVTPNDGKPVGADGLSLEFSSPEGGSMSVGDQPLVFSKSRLAEMVERVQKRSLEESGDVQKVLPLEKLLGGK